MPSYTYRCEKCGCGVDERHAAGKRLSLTCPNCNHSPMQWQFPICSIQTDSTFFAGAGTLLDQFDGDEAELNRVMTNCKKQGGKPSLNDFYAPGIARSTGDPAAFIPASGGRGYVKQLCEQRGTGCEGMVNVKARPKDKPLPKTRLAKKTVKRIMRHEIRQDPSKAQNLPALRQAIIEKHGSSNTE